MTARPTLRWCCLLVSAFALAASAVVHASGLAGVPISQRIGPDEYRAAPSLWSVAAAPGKIYVASADGVLVHDGVEWATVPLPIGVDATVVRRFPDGTIMVGGNDTYGRLELDPVRGYRYVDLLASSGLPEADRRLGPVWEMVQSPEGIYVQAQHFLHLMPASGAETRSWPMGPDMRSIMSFGGDLYARIQDRGLGWLRDGKLQLVPGGEAFRRVPVSGIVGWGGSRFVVAGNGVWRLDDSGVQPALAWPDGELAAYVTVPLDGGGFALATLDGEVLVVDAGLRLRQRVKIADQSVADLTRDSEGALWAVTDTEVVRLGMPSAWSILDHTHGVRGLVSDTAEFDGALWVATARGLFRLTDDGGGSVQSERMPWVQLEGYGLLADERAMLIGEREGLRELKPGAREPRTLHGGESVSGLQLVRNQTDLAVACSENEFFLLAYGAEGWAIEARWPLQGMAIIDIIQTAEGEFWLSDDRGPPQRWRFDLAGRRRIDVDAFGEEQGLPIDGEDRPKLFFIDGELRAWAKGRTYRYDPDAGRFAVTDTPDWIAALVKPGKLSVVETTMGLFAYTPRDLMRRPASTMAWERVQIGGWSSTGFGTPRVSRGGVLRVPVWNGILQYAPEGPVLPMPDLAVGFDQLLVQDDDGELRAGEMERDSLSLRSGQPLRMRFTLGTLEPGARFRYRLSGIAPEFSDWADRDLTIRGLDPGEYQFDVESQLPSGRKIAPLRLRLLVQPRWFEEPALRGLLLIAVVGLAVWASRAIGRRRVVRVEAQNRQLEQRIADRTLELERANARLAEMAVEDPLTGTQNRRALEQALGREWARCAEQGLPLAALMIDVDHFKRYNDHHGHLEGDRVLIDVAALLRTDLSVPVEILARYGGEEFTLLLPGATLEAAARRAEHLREIVEHARTGVTVSVGVAVAWPSPIEMPSALLRRADQALYEAKRQGRNRVVCADA
ncbi:MAG: diguanylate cyclase [Silanimonas sp.]